MERMPENDVEKFLAEEKAVEEHRKQLVEALLKQKDAAIKDFDEKLARLGYQGDGPGKTHRSHHRKGASHPAEKTKA